MPLYCSSDVIAEVPETTEQTLTPVGRVPFVSIIVSDAEGPINSLGSEVEGFNSLLKQWLSREHAPLTPATNLEPLGQDIFKTTRAFVFSILGCFYQQNAEALESFRKNCPETAIYSLVVYY